MIVRWSRVLVVTPSYEGTDGVSTVTRAYVAALASGGADAGLPRVDVWSLGDNHRPALLPEHVGFRAALGSRVRFATYAVRERRVDSSMLVIVQHVHLLPTVLALQARGARVMLLMHGIEVWKRLRALERLACRRAWKLAAVSAYTVRRFHRANPDLANRLVEICAPGLPARESTGLSRDAAPYALIVGRMNAAERYKGHDELIDVWPAVHAAVPGARLVIAGGGDDAARLEQKAAGLGLGEAVRFEGVVGDARLATLYQGAAVFAMPSANEGFGLVYVEALRAGVPCIVAAGAAEEIVEHERTGIVIKAGDRDALARAVIRLLRNREDRTRMSAAARAASSRFTAEAFATRLEALLC